MGILAECPVCHTKQSLKNKECGCGENLDKAKRATKVRYWISFRLPEGRQRREPVGFSIEEARDADGKRRGQKRENRIFDMLPESKMTFKDLTDWYLKLKTVQKLKSFNRVELALINFNSVFSRWTVSDIKRTDLETYQEDRKEQGKAAATIDMEVSMAKTVVIKAFDNDKIDGRVLKAFRSVKKKLKKGSNARKRLLSFNEYLKLLKASPSHLKAGIIIAFNTGMRLGEIRNMKWSHIDRKTGFIRLPAELTKEAKPKSIPINHHVRKALEGIPRALNHPHVIDYKGNPISSKDGTKRSFKTACKEANIPHGRKTTDGIIFHDIRRTVKTNMLSAGVDKVHRDMILGHSLQGMDVHYMVSSDEALKQAMDKYTTWLDAHLETASANVDQTVDQKEASGK